MGPPDDPFRIGALIFSILLGITMGGGMLYLVYQTMVLSWMPRCIQHLTQEGKLEEALRLALWMERQTPRLMETEKNKAVPKANLAFLYTRLGRLTEAVAHYEELLKLYRDSHSVTEGELHIELAWCLKALGREQEAQTHFVRGLELIPDNKVTALHAKGSVLHQNRRHAEAAVVYETLLTLLTIQQDKAIEPGIRSSLAASLLEVGRYEEARPHITLVKDQLDNSQGDWLWAETANLLTLLGEFQEADALITAGMQNNPAGLQGHLYQARQNLFFVQGRFPEVQKAFEETLTQFNINTNAGDVIRTKAYATVAEDPASTRKMLEKDRPNPEDHPLEAIQWHALYSQAQAALEERDVALSHLQQAVALLEPALSISALVALTNAHRLVVETALLLEEQTIARSTLESIRTRPLHPAYESMFFFYEGEVLSLEQSFTAARTAYRRASEVAQPTAYSEKASERLGALPALEDQAPQVVETPSR